MIKAFKIDLILSFKEIKISKLIDMIKFWSVIIAILVGIKYLTTLPPNLFPLKELFALTIGFLGVFKIRTDTISEKQIQMITFFPLIGTEKIKKYFLYKRPILVYLVILYLLFPVNFSIKEVGGFFFFLSIIMFMMFIDTLSYRLFPNSEIPDRINIVIRIGYFVIFATHLYTDNWIIEPETLVMTLDLWYLVLISLFFAIINPFVLTLPNRKEDGND